MTSPVINLVAAFLLVAQGLVGMAPGRVLCLPIADCGAHDSSESAGCGHDHDDCGSDHGCGSNSDDRAGHGHGPMEIAFHPHEECGCHVHVPVPGDDRTPTNPQPRGDYKELRALSGASHVLTIAWDFTPAARPSWRFCPPDLTATDQVRALKSTRLLI